MKTPKLQKNELGQYPNSIGESMQLTPQQARKVREVLSEGPIHLSELADRAGVPRTNAAKFSALIHLVEVHLQNTTREAEMRFGKDSKGRERFAGWALTKLGERMLEI